MNKHPRKASAGSKTTATPLRYFRSVDLLIAAVGFASKGMPNRAAKALAEAAQDHDLEQAMQQLNDQQQSLKDQDFSMQQQQEGLGQEQQLGSALTRLIKASSKQQASQEEDFLEDDFQEDLQEEDLQEEEADSTGVDAEDDLDIDMEDDFGEDEVEDRVQASVQARLAKAARNKALRGE